MFADALNLQTLIGKRPHLAFFERGNVLLVLARLAFHCSAPAMILYREPGRLSLQTRKIFDRSYPTFSNLNGKNSTLRALSRIILSEAAHSLICTTFAGGNPLNQVAE